jgi:2'-5' RNA ligase
MSFRAFVAVDVECGERLLEVLGELQGFGRSLKPVSPGNVHVTLKFLGDTEEGSLPELERAMVEAVRGIAPFRVRLVGTGAFPNVRNPRVVWAGMEGAEPLTRAANALEEGCEPLGFRRERRAFSPHLTLARVREGYRVDLTEFLSGHEGEELGSFTVEAIKLKRSVLTPSGPIYSDVLDVRL